MKIYNYAQGEGRVSMRQRSNALRITVGMSATRNLARGLQSINELIPSDENDSSTNIVQDNLYELYISFINAIEEFSDNPLGFQIVIQSSEGINVSPDLAQLFESTGSEENLGLEHYYNISVMQFLSNLLASENSSIVINANPDTK